MRPFEARDRAGSLYSDVGRDGVIFRGISLSQEGICSSTMP